MPPAEMAAQTLAVILCGGSGTRLWPLSRSRFPKQFHAIHGNRSLLTATAARVGTLPGHDVMAVCNEDNRFLVAAQLGAGGAADSLLLLEPAPRGTAAAVAAVASHAVAAGRDPLLLVLPADHLIGDEDAFRRAMVRGLELAADGWLVVFGVAPRHVEPGYGYIVPGEPLDREGACRVARFVEKPQASVAAGLIDAGARWNSGIFAFRASRFLTELKAFNGAMAAACRHAVERLATDRRFLRLDPRAWQDCPADSIDCAVMEKTSAAAVVPLDCRWNDIGSWQGVWEAGAADGDGNVIHGDVHARDVRGSLIWAGERLVVADGVRDLVIVDSDDAVLVTRRDGAQDVREVVAALRAENRPEVEQHRTVHRPWGRYRSVDRGRRFQVKRLVLDPGARISLQRHRHRSEHWVVVSGVARITRGGEVVLLEANQSAYIPAGTVHRLENAGDATLEVIEVQTGDYLGEDDIERFEDEYGRSPATDRIVAK